MEKPKQWPNLFVVGAAKAGTTSLHHYLSQHPEIYMSPVKEPHFFSQINPEPRFVALSGCTCIKNEQAYLKLFEQGSAQKIRGEASPSYLWDCKTSDRIKRVSPDAKVIIMLREPVSRAYSHYLNDLGAGLEKRPFLQAIEAEMNAPIKAWGVSSLYVDLGFYSDQIERYLNSFDSVLVLFFEEFIKDINGELKKIFKFLEVDYSHADNIKHEVMNAYAKPKDKISKFLFENPGLRVFFRLFTPPSLRPFFKSCLLVKGKKPDIDPQACQLLNDIYKNEADRLYKILKRDIPWSS